ncbi:MAG: [Oscillospiraceae bacterium]|nr:[FeFe] hydrogenase, group A [Oscillospiraceae bacterium]
MAINMSVLDDIITIDKNVCKGCTKCARNCPAGAIVGAVKVKHEIDPAKCVNCGYCVSQCMFGAIKVQNDKERFKALLADPSKKVAVQFSPATRVGLGEMFGVKAGTDVTGKMVAALKKLGVDYVYDTNVSADLTILEETGEFLERVKTNGKFPMFTSCCPGWIRYAEKNYPEYLPNISTCRSPMQMQSPFTKEYHKLIKNEDVVSCAIMPCTAKKYEAKRSEFMYDGAPVTEVVLTVVELGELIKEADIDFANLADVAADDPFGYGSGGAVIFGVTGGVAEAVVRYVANTVLNVPMDQTVQLSTTCGLRDFDNVKEATVKVGDLDVKIAVVHGLKNMPEFMAKIKSGELFYHLIEIMACPTGCVGGAGQPKADDALKQVRGKGLYNSDASYTMKASNENPAMKYLYENVIKGRNHELLHVHYEH